MKKKIWFFDLLRCIAATAVVTIHVLGPYRRMLGEIPDHSWAFAVICNSFSRWAVPVFVLTTGALMLNDTRPFDLKYYLKKRLGKVLLPFLLWSVVYAVIAAFTVEGIDFSVTFSLIKQLPFNETYYHLGFFYYFIPLYLVIPIFRKLVEKGGNYTAGALLAVWLVLVTANLAGYKGFFAHNMFFFSGYLIAGYLLLRSDDVPVKLLGGAAVAGLLITAYMTVTGSLEAGKYTTGRWLSYKTVNTVFIAMGIFAVCRAYGDALPEKLKTAISFVSRYSLGIYLLHPLFLWPVRAYDLYWGHSVLMIPLWTVICGGLALLTAHTLSRSRIGARLLP